MTVEEIENIICISLAAVIDVPPEKLARDTSFDALGLDSISRVGLVTQLERPWGEILILNWRTNTALRAAWQSTWPPC